MRYDIFEMTKKGGRRETGNSEIAREQESERARERESERERE